MLLDEAHERVDYNYGLPCGLETSPLFVGRLALVFPNLKADLQNEFVDSWDTCGGDFHSWSHTKKRQRPLK